MRGRIIEAAVRATAPGAIDAPPDTMFRCMVFGHSPVLQPGIGAGARETVAVCSRCNRAILAEAAPRCYEGPGRKVLTVKTP